MKDLLKKVLLKIDEETPEHWKDEILFRYLLTKGDSLGGRMRNLVGAEASSNFTVALQEALKNQKTAFQLTHSASNNLQSIAWQERCLLFNKKPKLFDKSIDAILLITTDIGKPPLEELPRYLACGEIKGGIDPAGADEHWKTANSALGRIRDVCRRGKKPVHLFFAGAAIESSMAKEIFAQLKSNQLEYAANLTSKEQTRDLAEWLISL